MKDEWEGLDSFKDVAFNIDPRYLRKAIDILSRREGYTHEDVINLAHNIDKVSHGYGIFGSLPEKDARENWLDFIKRENAEDILSPDDFDYGGTWGEYYSNDSPTGIQNPADYLPAMKIGDAYEKQTVYEDIDGDGDTDKITIEEKA